MNKEFLSARTLLRHDVALHISTFMRLRRWLLPSVCAGMSLCLSLTVEAQQKTQAPKASTAAPVINDTTMRPGYQDWARYETPGACLQGAVAAANIAKRADWDTAVYAPLRDTMPTAAVAIARSCSRKFSVSSVRVSDLLDFLHLALIAGNDTLANAIADRYVATAPNAEAKRWALYNIDTTYLSARPMRLDAAETIAARLDSLGPAAALQRGMAHFEFLSIANNLDDVPRLRHHALAQIATYPDLTEQDRSDRSVALTNAAISLFEINWHDSPKEAPERTLKALEQIHFKRIPQLRQAFQALHYDWAVAHIGTPQQPLSADFWVGPDSSAHTWPIPGKVSIYMPVGPIQDATWMWGPKYVARWQRLIKKYGDAINITLLCTTRGYFGDGPPLTTKQEVERLRKFFAEDVKLPVTIAIDTITFRELPDGRRFPENQNPWKQDAYYQWSFGMTDAQGKALLYETGLPSEAAVDKLVARALHK
jgi:hypothetical protein